MVFEFNVNTVLEGIIIGGVALGFRRMGQIRDELRALNGRLIAQETKVEDLSARMNREETHLMRSCPHRAAEVGK